MSARSFNRTLRDDDDEDFLLGSTSDRSANGKGSRLGGRLDARLKRKPRGASSGPQRAGRAPVSHASDPRQRVIVKVHYYRHGGGGAAALGAHGAYIERESARLDQEDAPHADYLSRDGAHGFYDEASAGVPGRERLARWAREDGRHFRIILSPENGQGIGDLTGFTREVMARAEAELGRKLEWVAVNHWDTDNPHTHLVLRGRDGAGKPLSLPDDFIKHRFREIARDVASERLGPRTPDDERRALEREVRAPRPTRFDRAIAEQPDPAGKVRMADLGKAGPDPAFVAALKSRLAELARLGLAEETKRGTFALAPDWQARLKGLELHADIRRGRFAKARNVPALESDRAAFERAARDLSEETGKPHRGLGDKMQRWTVRGERDLPTGRYLALERHDRVALAPKPPGLDIAAGQRVSAGLKDGAVQIVRALGMNR